MDIPVYLTQGLSDRALDFYLDNNPRTGSIITVKIHPVRVAQILFVLELDPRATQNGHDPFMQLNLRIEIEAMRV